jgi:methanogenic corrinoid protein MtbC1/DNA-binding XRE family transcriptional regulator
MAGQNKLNSRFAAPTERKLRVAKASVEPFHDPYNWTGRYREALLAGDSKVAGEIAEELLAARYSAQDIYFHLIEPAMVQVGDLWCRGDIGVGSEHLATQIVLKQLDQLRFMQPAPARHMWHRVLVACVEGEEHFVGARMLADLCAVMGWSVDYLGPNTPSDSIIEMVRQRKSRLLTLSATIASGVEHIHRIVEKLATLAEVPRLIVGGAAVAKMAGWRVGKVQCSVVNNILQGIELAQTLLRRDRPKAVLREYLLDLGRRVRELRNQKAWTQEQLAEASHVTRVCIVAVEGGKQNVSMDIVVRIANALETAPERLLVGND